MRNMDALDLNSIDTPNIGVERVVSNDIEQNSTNVTHNVNTEAVRSKAVVTYSAAKYPALFSQLAPFTNINLAPSNWLRNAPGLRPGVLLSGNRSTNYTPCRTPTFSSFQMADAHLDYMGEIDVVSDAENIKKLLKVPYSKAHVSMAVHRIGKTLFLDKFDLPHESVKGEGWKWFKLMYEQMTQQVATKKKLRSAQLYRQRLSKFLYYSVQGELLCQEQQNESLSNLSIEEEAQLPVESQESCTLKGNSEEITSPKTPDASGEKINNMIIPAELRWKYWTPNDSGPSQYHDIRNTFERTIFWTFEDLQMLLGTNMPIFGGGDYPAVSLKLQDSDTPINVLTGIDYWLDNLICNVPEVVMCFHVNGIVQNYEVIKTEEIPKLSNTKFSPQVIKDIAQNILSFLKSNCTKEGHTYWLFKGSQEDVVKLYDLTTLCNQKNSTHSFAENSHNPFTLSVATLFYKVAVNLMQQPTKSADQTANIMTLLENCVVLLEKHIQLAPVLLEAALCMLSTLCLPDSPDAIQSCNVAMHTESSQTNSVFQSGNNKQEAASSSAENNAEVAVISSVNELSIPDKFKNVESLKSNTQPETYNKDNFGAALSFIIKGLYVFNEFTNVEMNVVKDCKDLMLVHMQMIRNVSLVYYALAKQAFTNKHWGCSLKCIRLALLSYDYLEQLVEPSNNSDDASDNNYDVAVVLQGTIPPDFNLLLPRLFVLSGDLQMMQLQWNQQEKLFVQEEFENLSDNDLAIQKALKKNLPCAGEKYIQMTKLVSNADEILSTSRICYDTALVKFPIENEPIVTTKSSKAGNQKIKASKRSKAGNPAAEDQTEKSLLKLTITRKLGHVANEQGAFHLNKSIALLETSRGDNSKIDNEKAIWKLSYDHLETALNCFTEVNDYTNQALVLSNLGRLMRICAQSTSQWEQGRFTSHERELYGNAIEYYKKALSIQVKNRKSGTFEEGNLPSVNDNISWELSGTYFTMAQRLQDNAPLNLKTQDEIEREIISLLNKSQKNCSDIWKNTEKRSSAQYRCALIHYRLGSLYHNSFQQADDSVKKRHYRNLAEVQYDKSCTIYCTLSEDHMCEFLRVVLERVALKEQQLSFISNQSTKFKLILEGVDLTLLCVKPLTVLSSLLQSSLNQSFDAGSTSVDPEEHFSSDRKNLNVDTLKEWIALVNILSTILTTFLLSLLKLTKPATGLGLQNTSAKKKSNVKKADTTTHIHYKQLYSRMLHLQSNKISAMQSEIIENSQKSHNILLNQFLPNVKALLEIINQLKL